MMKKDVDLNKNKLNKTICTNKKYDENYINKIRKEMITGYMRLLNKQN